MTKTRISRIELEQVQLDICLDYHEHAEANCDHICWPQFAGIVHLSQPLKCTT